MHLKKLLLTAAAVVCGPALAQAPQAPLGTVVNVQGVVTASQGATAAAVVPGSPIVHGMRFATTSTGSVTLRLASGCVVTLQPNQAVTVLRQMSCQQLAAAVTPVTAVPVATITPVVPAAAATPAVPGALLAIGGVALAAAIVNAVDDDEPSVSPN